MVSKKYLKGVKIIITLITVVLLLATPTLSSAAFIFGTTTSNSFADIIKNRYSSVNEYKNYLSDFSGFLQGMDSNMNVDDAKIQILDELETLQDSYNKSTVIPSISTQIMNQTVTSSSTNTSDLLESLTGRVKTLLGNTNLVIESLTPNVVIDNMVAATAGERCGEDYKVKLVGRVYYADIDKSGKPTSNKWAFLVNGSNMTGQAMADAIGQMYIDKGYNLLAIDSRGNGDSEGSIAMGYVESLDVWDWLTYLNKNFDCDQVILHGISLGAATVVFSSGLEVNGKTLKDQNVIGLVEDCGYTSLTGILKGLLGISTGSDSSSNLSKEVKTKAFGISDKLDLSSISIDGLVDSVLKKLLIENLGVGLTEENFDEYQNALDSLDRSELPLLIIHGTKDSMVPYENSDKIYEAAMSNEKIPYVQRYTVEGGQHASIVLGTKYNVYEGHVHNFIEKSEEVAEGKTVNKVSDYQQEEEQKTSIITSLIRALKLIKNMIKL